jgi:2-polyprenyl-3-methyl-5-hydroxy-6-metoxy-1,4-benzoquinol methylase
MTGASRDEHRRRWDERHGERTIESAEPNPILVAEAAKLSPGTALDVGCGDGTNAAWLASRGWRVTGVDWSGVALAKAQASAEGAGVTADWIEADLMTWTPPAGAFDLVTIVYLHLPVPERRAVYRAAATAVAPGGMLLIVGHDRTNLTDGAGGPQDPDRLFTAAELAHDLLADDPEFEIEEAGALRRRPGPERGPIDAVLRARRAGPNWPPS